MNLLTIVLYTAGILTVLSVLLLAFIIMLRILTDRRLRHDAEFRSRAKPLIRSFLSGEVTAEVTRAVLDKNPHAAIQVLLEEADVLGETGRHKLLPLLEALPVGQRMLDHLRSRSWERRLRAAEYLGYLGDDTSIPALMNALRDDAIAVRFAVATALARLGCQNAVEPILLALDSPGEVSQRRVAEVLQILGARACDPILAILQRPSANENSLGIAVRVAGKLRLHRAIDPLRHLLGHESVNVRLNAVRSLASIGDHSVSSEIATLGEDSSWEVRSSVMQALGRLNARDRIPLLLQGLTDPEWWVRFNAAEALHTMGDPGISALRNASEHHSDAFGRDISRQILQQHEILKP
jgi:HEAT repeat protein